MDNHGGTKDDALLAEIIEEKYVTLIGQLEQFSDFTQRHDILFHSVAHNRSHFCLALDR